MASLALAMLTEVVVARYCTEDLYYCGKSLNSIGTLLVPQTMKTHGAVADFFRQATTSRTWKKCVPLPQTQRPAQAPRRTISCSSASTASSSTASTSRNRARLSALVVARGRVITVSVFEMGVYLDRLVVVFCLMGRWLLCRGCFGLLWRTPGQVSALFIVMLAQVDLMSFVPRPYDRGSVSRYYPSESCPQSEMELVAVGTISRL
jgi:hypothetical protein